jgi:Carboxypeptidase regulatory-like domain
VTITNVASGEKRVQPTGADGFYNFVNLIPGTYRTEVEKPGFKHVTHPDVIVQVLACAGLDRLGITSEELCDRFKTDPNRVKKLWAELTAEKEKAAAAK